MSLLDSDERRALLKIARKALRVAVQTRLLLEVIPPPGTLSRPAGAFVTLRRGQRLRGCIGRVEANGPLVEVVAHCAMSAALADPRFEPVTERELPAIEIEISVLSPAEPVVPEQIEIGKHGLLVSRGGERGVLLPQVAEEFHWSAERFLAETCAKCGLPKEAWRDPSTSVQAFTAEVFSEQEWIQERTSKRLRGLG